MTTITMYSNHTKQPGRIRNLFLKFCLKDDSFALIKYSGKYDCKKISDTIDGVDRALKAISKIKSANNNVTVKSKGMNAHIENLSNFCEIYVEHYLPHKGFLGEKELFEQELTQRDLKTVRYMIADLIRNGIENGKLLDLFNTGLKDNHQVDERSIISDINRGRKLSTLLNSVEFYAKFEPKDYMKKLAWVVADLYEIRMIGGDNSRAKELQESSVLDPKNLEKDIVNRLELGEKGENVMSQYRDEPEDVKLIVRETIQNYNKKNHVIY